VTRALTVDDDGNTNRRSQQDAEESTEIHDGDAAGAHIDES
jgi:hypothetical protein